ncbi:uncharacterized protein LOC114529953 isoform X2 [Dendronephthya gigantea]|uniref:uncharacterized protein LOC114529953 isoform X2 n=1 Tax=Dendronephthya gigantea TaxID=151771 RepID=UPI00106B5E08|nr:uncharacterized protein LOC114529953 isoform X2 [Dendronephthya gigantea]
MMMDAEYTINAKTVAPTISYQEATAICKADGKVLCGSNVICKGGRPHNGFLSGDHWVPVIDSYNEWIQIGNSIHVPCVLHSSLGFKPSWGLKNTARGYKGNLFCCKKKDAGIVIKAVSNKILYQEAAKSCQTDGKQLCASHDICKGSTPYGGPLYGDHWVPVKDSSNEWLQIGNSPHKPCTLHSHLGFKPGWGISWTRRSYGFKGYVMCCKT